MSNFNTKIFIIILMSLGYFATDIYLPSLPAIGVSFGVDDSLVQLTIFSYIASFSFFPLIAGPISDRIGRKKVITFGMTISLLSTVGACFQVNIYWLILMRFLQGTGNAFILIANRSMMTDLFHGAELAKQISYMTMMMPFMLALAPVIGGYLQVTYDWQAVFIFMTGFLALLTIALPWLRESHTPEVKVSFREIGRQYLSNLQNFHFMLFGLCMGVPSFGVFAYLTSSPYIFQEIYGLSPKEYGFTAVAIGVVITLSSITNTKLINYYKPTALIAAASVICIFAGLLMFLMEFLGFNHWLAALLPVLIYFSVLPIGGANAVSKALSYIKENFGTANAMLSTGQFISGAFASLLFSFLPEQSLRPLGYCFVGCGLLLVLCLLLTKIIPQND